jgi:hypothetical protein
MALQPAQAGLQLGHRHLRTRLVGENPLQDGVVAVAEPVSDVRNLHVALILEGLIRDYLANASAQAPLGR